MKNFWPSSLAGQMITLLLLSLVVSQGVTLLIYLDERRQAVRSAERAQVLSRMASIVRLLAETPPELSSQITETASGPNLVFWLAQQSVVDIADSEARSNPLRARLQDLLAGTGAREVLVRLEDGDGKFFDWRRERARFALSSEGRSEQHEEHQEGHDDDEHHADERSEDNRHWSPPHRRLRALSLTLSVLLPDDRWLNGETLVPTRSPDWAWPSLVSMLAMAAAITLIVAFSVRRITRPLRQLEGAAERFGRGEEVGPLAEEGPDDLRRTIRAFNAMRDRLDRFVRDRTRMLAAISHDLRTPITTLRLRAEFVEDAEAREKMLETLDEMQQMAEAALAFAREDAAREDTRRVDLVALIQSLCDDFSDAGADVAFQGPEKATFACRPVALKRALRNLIENAIAYGQRACVLLEAGEEELRVVIEDEGPGIPEEQFEQVFEPFFRLETSRSGETGGVGLGLAITRSIIHGHGGKIRLENRASRGLRAIVSLPRLAKS